jgi:hypothetical protein
MARALCSSLRASWPCAQSPVPSASRPWLLPWRSPQPRPYPSARSRPPCSSCCALPDAQCRGLHSPAVELLRVSLCSAPAASSSLVLGPSSARSLLPSPRAHLPAQSPPFLIPLELAMELAPASAWTAPLGSGERRSLCPAPLLACRVRARAPFLPRAESSAMLSSLTSSMAVVPSSSCTSSSV